VILGMMQVSKRIPFEDPTWLTGIRGLYVLSNLIIVSIYLFVGKKIKDKNGTFPKPRIDDKSGTKDPTDQTTLKYVEPAAPMSGDEPKLVTTTVGEYDTSQLKSALKSVVMGVGMMGVMHIYFKYTNPLLIQSTCRPSFPRHQSKESYIQIGIIPVKTAIESKLVQIYLFNQPAAGDLKRPWKTQGFMQSMQGGGGEVKSDKKSIEEAERSGRGGVKEE
jgi:hypothetical protein